MTAKRVAENVEIDVYYGLDHVSIKIEPALVLDSGRVSPVRLINEFARHIGQAYAESSELFS